MFHRGRNQHSAFLFRVDGYGSLGRGRGAGWTRVSPFVLLVFGSRVVIELLVGSDRFGSVRIDSDAALPVHLQS